MSNKDQVKFLTALKEEITTLGSKEGNKAQRVLYNKRAQDFVLSKRAINKAIRESFIKNNDKSKSSHVWAHWLTQQVSGDVSTFIEAIYNRFKGQSDDKAKVIEYTGEVLKVAVFPTGKDTFARVKGVYNADLTVLFEAIKSKAEKKGSFPGARGETFQLEHDHFMGILETTMQDALENAVSSQAGKDKNSLAQLKEWLKSQEVDVKIIRNGKNETMSVFLGSSVVNDIEAKDAQRAKAVLLKVLDKALDNLANDPAFKFENLAGSDSIKTARRKNLIKRTTKNFKKQKHVKVTTEDLDIKLSKTNKETSFGPKAVTATSFSKATKIRKSKEKKKPGPADMPLAEIMAKFNARINEEVRSNMDFPALVNRTGRFASSVLITDVVKTPRGFNSVGYTYQKDPYQTFEMGGAQGSPHRDPRKLIEQSMREIAVDFAMGRLYTRRV
tara:strand:- start:488 stop:1816 length:1329 start_codon:yes stop_codon:yes gene_type:complete